MGNETCGCVWSIYKADKDAAEARADAAEARAVAAEREANQLRADRSVLAPVVLSLLGVQARHIVPADPLPLLMALRAQTLTLLGSHDNVDATDYLRAMFARLDAEAQPAGEVADG